MLKKLMIFLSFFIVVSCVQVNEMKTEKAIESSDITYLETRLSEIKSSEDPDDAIDREKQVLLECKHRTNTHDEYPDTIIGVNKYLASREKYPDWDFYASFLFADGMYYYKFDNTKTLEEQGIFTSTRQYNKMITNGYVKEHLNIPITKLTRVGKISSPLAIPKGVCLINL